MSNGFQQPQPGWQPVTAPQQDAPSAQHTVSSLDGMQRPTLGPGMVVAERYRLIRKLGEGGMGEVWEATHVLINKRVALKMLLPRADGSMSLERTQRLLREAQAAAHINHPHIVEITDYGQTPTGQPFIAMEFLQGLTLKDFVARNGAIEYRRAVGLLTQMAQALEAAHAKGVIHRDLKPDNVFVLDRGPAHEFVKIIDFGIAKLTMLDPDAQSFTKTGLVYGTPAFMSPEQGNGEKIDARTDVYALGCIAYQMLTGEAPFSGKTITEVLFKQIFEPPPSMREVAPHAIVPPTMEALVRRCLCKKRDNRFQSMTEVLEALSRVDSAPPVEIPQEELPKPPGDVQMAFARPGSMASAQAMGADTLSDASLPFDGARPEGSRKGSGLAIVIALAALVVGGGGATWWYMQQHGAADRDASEPGLSQAEDVAAGEVETAVVAAPVMPEPGTVQPADSAGAAALDDANAEGTADSGAQGAGQRGASEAKPAADGANKPRSKKNGGEAELPPPPPDKGDHGDHAESLPPPDDAEQPPPAPEPEPEPDPQPEPEPEPKPVKKKKQVHDGDLINPF